MSCKIEKNCGSGASNKMTTKLECILEADESTRMRVGKSIPHNHEDYIARKGENSLQHYNLDHKFIPMPQAVNIPAAKAAVEKCENWRFRRGNWQNKEIRKKWSMKQRSKAPKIQRSNCTPKWYWKKRYRVLRRMHWTKIFSISNDSRQNHGHHLQIARVRRRSSRRNISLDPYKNVRCLQIIGNSKIWMSRRIDTPSKTQIPEIVVQCRKTKCFSWAEFVWASLNKTFVKTENSTNLNETWWEKVPIWYVYLLTRNKDCSCRYTLTTSRWLGKSRISHPCGRNLFRRTYAVLWSRVFGTSSTWMQTKCNYYWRIHENNWITHFCKNNGKNFLGWKKNVTKKQLHGRSMERNAQQFVERYCELATKKVEQLNIVSNSCLDDHQFNKEELESVEEISQVRSQIVLNCTNGETWHLVVNGRTCSIRRH